MDIRGFKLHSCVLILVLSLGFLGCSGEYVVTRGNNGGYVVSLTPEGGANGSPTQGGFQPPSPGNSGGIGGGNTEPANPPAPGNNSRPPSSSGPPADIPSSAEGQLEEIRDTYGIRVRGYPTERDIQNLLVSCRQYRPEETAGVSINYARGNRSSGVMGCYSPSGQMEIYDHRNLHTILHELTHHITLYPRNSRCKDIAERMTRMTPPERGTLRQVPSRYIPSSYARTMTVEYWAEFFSFLREKEQGIRGGYPCSRAFNPPEEIRQVARQIYVD